MANYKLVEITDEEAEIMNNRTHFSECPGCEAVFTTRAAFVHHLDESDC